ncbi:MAG: cytochrome c oxidase subunit II [Alphaproteobacteria bacterium]|nr:cytochrome c oxidase subunit II [Alphaproteobacteria bacterium]
MIGDRDTRKRRAPWRAGRIAPAVAASAFLAVSWPAHAAHPLSYLSGHGTKSYSVVQLTWGLLAISVIVVVVVSVLLLAGLLRQRPSPAVNDPKLVPPRRPQAGLGWIYVGTAISAVALFGSAIWTFSVLAAVSVPRAAAADFKIDIVGHQWWWEVRYAAAKTPMRNVVTANEIHIPTGRPIRFVVQTADVIHSFWVPGLSGKMEAIPGQYNELWLEADQPGVYRGQCSEYCGQQHAHMGFVLVAERPDRFQSWWDHQLAPAPPPDSALSVRGEAAFIANCGICHTVNGTAAGGRIGPDLTHLMGRLELAAGTLPNTIGYLSGWIADPQRIKPGNQMPTLTLSGPQLTDIRAFLETLQ